MVGILLCYWGGLLSGATLVSGRVPVGVNVIFFFQCLLHGNFCHPGSFCSKNAWCGRRVEWHQLPKKSAWNGFSQPIVFVHEIGARIKICWLSFMWFHARTTKSWSSPFLSFGQVGEVHLLIIRDKSPFSGTSSDQFAACLFTES